MRKVKITRGKKYNHLTAISYYGISDKGFQMWECECDCADKKRCIVKASDLLSGHKKSCGCRKNVYSNKRHGLSYTRIYNIHQKMIQRCYKETCREYQNYGARGIKVCDEWKGNVKVFYDWAMENGYADNLSIDRIDVNGNYEPSNCRWADYKTQANNTRKNRNITFNGETHTLSEWGEKTQIGSSNIYARLKLGWSVERALTQKVKGR